MAKSSHSARVWSCYQRKTFNLWPSNCSFMDFCFIACYCSVEKSLHYSFLFSQRDTYVGHDIFMYFYLDEWLWFPVSRWRNVVTLIFSPRWGNGNTYSLVWPFSSHQPITVELISYSKVPRGSVLLDHIARLCTSCYRTHSFFTSNFRFNGDFFSNDFWRLSNRLIIAIN